MQKCQYYHWLTICLKIIKTTFSEFGEDSSKNKFYAVAKDVSGLGQKLSNSKGDLDIKVNQRILMMRDMIEAYKDMVERHDKGLVKEHKVATEKIGMIKCRQTKQLISYRVS